jgi:hypothetical protein
MSIIESLREPKLFGFVLFDWISTIIGALLLANYLDYDFWVVLITLLIISIYLHWYFNTPTLTNYYLGISSNPRISTNPII